MRTKVLHGLWALVLVLLSLTVAGYVAFAQNNSVEFAGPDSGAALQGLQPGESEIRGVVTSFDGTTLVVAGQAFLVTGADIDGVIRPGDLVEVEFIVDASGVRIAREVDREDDIFDNDNLDNDNLDNDNDDGNDGGNFDPNEFRLRGPLQSTGPGFIVVSGLQIDTRTARIEDALVVGRFVDVRIEVVNGRLVARAVRLTVFDDDDDDFDDDNFDNDRFDNDNLDNDNLDNDNFDNDNDDTSGRHGRDDDDDNSGRSGSNSGPGGGDDDDHSGRRGGDDDDRSGRGGGDDDSSSS